jgi:hypothetical protein
MDKHDTTKHRIHKKPYLHRLQWCQTSQRHLVDAPVVRPASVVGCLNVPLVHYVDNKLAAQQVDSGSELRIDAKYRVIVHQTEDSRLRSKLL